MGRDNKRIASLREAAKVEAAVLVRSVADPQRWGESVQARIARFATRLGWSFRRTEDIWRREAHRIEVWEMDALRNWQPDEKGTGALL